MFGSGLYVMDTDGTPILVEDVQEWGRICTQEHRRIARDVIGDYIVSTVFLGVDHAFEEGPPILWETMIFTDKEGDELYDFQQRYTSLADAVEAHGIIVQGLTEDEG